METASPPRCTTAVAMSRSKETLVSRSGPIDVSLTLTPTRRASDALRTMLSLLGPANDAGGVHLAWHGSP